MSAMLSLASVDDDLLRRFELGLDPANPQRSDISFAVIGYGEISTVFTIEGGGPVAYKRMPLFETADHAARYVERFRDYTEHLRDAGLLVPPQETAVITAPGRPVVLYIAQPLFSPERFCHVRIRDVDEEGAREIAQVVSREVARIWEWNASHAPQFELSLDGQLSNWVCPGDDPGRPYYVDTSTPLYRVDGAEQLDSELFLKSAPGMLRWVLRLFFVEDVMTRYYDLCQVLRDLAANLYKEGREDLVPAVVEEINALTDGATLSVRDVDKYYSEDKTIWRFYLAFRRLDRFITARVLKKRYEFLLPGRIRR